NASADMSRRQVAGHVPAGPQLRSLGTSTAPPLQPGCTATWLRRSRTRRPRDEQRLRGHVSPPGCGACPCRATATQPRDEHRTASATRLHRNLVALSRTRRLRDEQRLRRHVSPPGCGACPCGAAATQLRGRATHPLSRTRRIRDELTPPRTCLAARLRGMSLQGHSYAASGTSTAPPLQPGCTATWLRPSRTRRLRDEQRLRRHVSPPGCGACPCGAAATQLRGRATHPLSRTRRVRDELTPPRTCLAARLRGMSLQGHSYAASGTSTAPPLQPGC